MSVFKINSKIKDINEGVSQLRDIPDALLLDVRSAAEYASGHIPGSVNVPLQALEKISDVADSFEQPIFVYCKSGIRSAQARQALLEMGYSNVSNLGGIMAYSGALEY